MNPPPPINQEALHIYRGNFAGLRARQITFQKARASFRNWTIHLMLANQLSQFTKGK